MMNCATLGLETYVPSEEQPWDVGRVQHLFRRAGFGARPDEIVQALQDGPAATVNRILDTALTRESRPDPVWAEYDYDDFMANGLDVFESFISLYYNWIDDAITYGVREKLSLFWQNHLVTIYETHSCPAYQLQYMKLIDQYAFGDYREFIREMTKTPAMLFFLNGFENTRENPNENYARELFELFTLGENIGYTQEDIVEASRALTGWNGWTSYCGGVEWADWGYDDTEKTIFGRTGNYNYSSLIDVLFEERSELIARFICGKLYNYYVNKAANEEVIEAMAQTFIANDYQILPVLRELFASAHFFESSNIGTLIKAPMEVMVNFLRQGDFGDFENRQEWGLWSVANMGQYVGHPTDVAGWKGDRAWIDSNRLTLRWDFIDGFSWAIHNENLLTYPNLAKLLTDSSNSPEVIARTFVDYFVPRGLVSETAYETAIDVLKWDIPSNYYDTGEWNLDWDTASWQLTLLLRHIARLPEAQLN